MTSTTIAMASPPAAVMASTVSVAARQVDGRDLGALGGEQLAGHPAHAAGGARDERHLAVQPTHSLLPRVDRCRPCRSGRRNRPYDAASAPTPAAPTPTGRSEPPHGRAHSSIVGGERRRRPTATTFTVLDPGHRRAARPRSPRPDRPTSSGRRRRRLGAFEEGRGPAPAPPSGAGSWPGSPTCCGSGPRRSPGSRPRDAGHPIGDARWEVDAAARTFEYYAGAANKHLGQVVPVTDAGPRRRAARAGRRRAR